MVLLDKLQRRLRDTGHRVLVFSQVRQEFASCEASIVGSGEGRRWLVVVSLAPSPACCPSAEKPMEGVQRALHMFCQPCGAS
jgi:hypothetical protein